MANLIGITGETRPIMAETDISKTAFGKNEENVSKIINMMESVSNSFKFDVNKHDEDRASLVNIANGAVLPTTWLINFLLPKRMGRTKLMSLLNKR